VGLLVEWCEGDCELLLFVDVMFDVVLLCVGVMFVLYYDVSVVELLCVCWLGGIIVFVSWMLEGFVGELFVMMKVFILVFFLGLLLLLLWGDFDYVMVLFGVGVSDFRVRCEYVNVIVFDCFVVFCELFKYGYGFMVVVYCGLVDYFECVEEFDYVLDMFVVWYL